MKENRSLNKKIWLTAAFFSATLILLVLIIFQQCKQLAIKEAEKNLAGFLLNHQAIRYFVEEIQKPEIYRLKDTEQLYREYFSPKLLSSTYIARNFQNALNNERQKKKLDSIDFKLASRNPRNRINLADAKELQLLEAFNAGTLQEYKTVLNTEKENVLYYAIPIAPNKQSCMRCHSDPAVAPKEMLEQYGDQAGFHEKIGDIRAFISVRVPMAVLLIEANKTAFILSSATFLLLSAAFIMVFYFFRKIDAQKKLAVENSYYLNSILQSSTDTAIVATDLSYIVKYFNHAAEQLFGVPATMALKSNIEEIHKRIGQNSTERFFTSIKRVQKQGSYGFTLEHNKKTLQIHVSAIQDNGGECAGFLLLGHDLSHRIAEEKERQEIKERLQKAETMESIGLMAGGVAHDLNNILSGIVNYPELILLKLPEDSDLRGPVKAVQESGKRAASVVADLLTVARGVASTREAHNLHLLIEDYFNSPEFKNLESSYSNIIYQHRFDSIQPNILCSSIHIKKCLMNLITNAAEAIIDKGTILVSTHDQTIDDAAAPAADNLKEGCYVVLSVRDTGPGISDKDLVHIFEPFYTKKVMGLSGTGLGLAIVWNTMQDHDGKIHVESNTEGTCFQLYFPISQEETAQAENIGAAIPTGNGESILVVDDEPQLRDIASQMLNTLGYRVESVCSGELAIQFLEENQVDLIIIDMLMEPGMNGRQTYEKILEMYPNQKALIVSGFAENDDVKAAMKLGASGFLNKPYSMDQLGRAAKDALSS